MDNMIAMMEKYSNHLEEIVAERTVELEGEKKKTETLLYRMLPRFTKIIIIHLRCKDLLWHVG